MTTTRDVVRSVQRYVAVVLSSPELAPLAEVTWTDDTPVTFRWSPGLVKDDLEIDAARWKFLLTQRYRLGSRTTTEGVVIGQVVLGDDPFAPALAAGLELPDDVNVDPLVTVTTVKNPPWDVRFWHERGEFTLPYAIVKAVTPARASGNAMWSRLTQPMHISVFPVDSPTAEDAQLRAELVREQLLHGFVDGVGLGHPFRVPLYDYNLVPDNETTDERDESDFLTVEDVSVETLVEPDDPRLVSVVADLRVAWWRVTNPRRGHRTLRDVRWVLPEA